MIADRIFSRSVANFIGQQLIVVLDGVNEHEHYAELMGSAVELASVLHGAGNVRIVLSFRSDIADWFLARQDPHVLEEAAPQGQTRGFHNPFYMDRGVVTRRNGLCNGFL